MMPVEKAWSLDRSFWGYLIVVAWRGGRDQKRAIGHNHVTLKRIYFRDGHTSSLHQHTMGLIPFVSAPENPSIAKHCLL